MDQLFDKIEHYLSTWNMSTDVSNAEFNCSIHRTSDSATMRLFNVPDTCYSVNKDHIGVYVIQNGSWGFQEKIGHEFVSKYIDTIIQLLDERLYIIDQIHDR